jgi:succinate dehydrogenase/fumarate reductase flavoprotein subunit
MIPAFLDDNDLKRLTGYKRPADQARWLEEHGIPFLRNRLGRLVVRRDLQTDVSEPELGPVP